MQKNEQTKTIMCIRMLQYLNDGRVWKVSELAEKLDTNPRNVIAYRQELCKNGGYKIETVKGKYGGYQLKKSQHIPSLNLTTQEKRSLMVANDHLRERADFLDYDLYQSAMSKIFSSTTTLPDTDETFIIPGVTLLMSNEDLHKRYHAIAESIKQKTKISIDFLSADNVVRTRIVRPYKLLISNNAWFVIGYCEKACAIRYFKLNRIESFKMLPQTFKIPSTFCESDYFDKEGFKVGSDWHKLASENKKTNEWVHVKLQFSGAPAMYVKEYKYGKNQVITAVDKDTTILECDMMYRYNTIRFVLGFGVDCKVLHPQWLKDEVKSIAKKMLQVD